MVFVPCLNAEVFLGQQVGILHFFGRIAFIIGNLIGTLADRAYTPVVASVIGIFSPIGPQLPAHGTVGIALYREREGCLGGLTRVVELHNTIVTQQTVGTPTGNIRHLNGKHALDVLVGLPVQTIFMGIGVVLGSVGVGIRPEVTLVADKSVSTVLDTILEP